MRLPLALLIILFLTACNTTLDMHHSPDYTATNKILDNQSHAITAQDEYKKLLAQREKE